MRFHPCSLVLFSGLALALAASAQDRARWMPEARFGVMTHYLADWQAQVHHPDMSVERWNQLVP
jgi:hypothetical protein